MSSGLPAEPSAQRGRGEKESRLYQATCLLHPCVWVVGSASSTSQRGQLGPSPEECGQGRERFFFMLVPSPPLCLCPLGRDPGTDSLL